MSAANPMIESTDGGARALEPSRPAEPLLRPATRSKVGTSDSGTFDSHDTIPAPPWFDESVEPTDGPPGPPR